MVRVFACTAIKVEIQGLVLRAGHRKTNHLWPGKPFSEGLGYEKDQTRLAH
jgi:hypothetical protein